MKKLFLTLAFLLLLTAPAWAATQYYMNTAGNDSYDGTEATHTTGSTGPWLSPNHALNCGDVITAAAGTYAQSMYPFGTVTCAAGNNVARLTCATFDACKISVTTSLDVGMAITASYWQVDGWEIDGNNTSAQCIVIESTGTTFHNIIIANNVITGCGIGGIITDNDGAFSMDYIAIIGNAIYGTSGGTANCASGISIYEPVNTDTLPGTHIYVAGNFSWSNVDGACNGGNPTDGEGLTFDTFSGLSYTGQAVADNNMFLANGGPGITLGGNGTSPLYIRHNTAWGNGLTNEVYCGEFISGNIAATQEWLNLGVTNKADCVGGSYVDYAFIAYGTVASTVIYNNWGYSATATNTNVVGGSGFTFGPNNTFGTSPAFANATTPGAPSCGSATSVPNCMATVIANFTPTTAAAKAYGYQIPGTASIYDPLYPQWLCNVTLPAGLVTPGCLTGSSFSGGTIH